MNIYKTLPANPDIEKVVLGTIMSHRYSLSEIRDILNESCFYTPSHQQIYRAIHAIDERGESPDALMVSVEIAKQGIEPNLYELSNIASIFTHDIYQHAAHLAELNRRRQVITIAQQLENNAFDESVQLPEMLAQAEEGLANIFLNSPEHISTLDETMHAVFGIIQKNHEAHNTITGTPTGLSIFDNKTGGLHGSDLTVIAADTSQGKTSLSISIAGFAAKNDAAIAIYSMEMPKEQITAKLLAYESDIPTNQILQSQLSLEEFEMLDKGVARLAGKKIYFDDRSTSNIDTIISSIRTLKMKYNINGAIVDYLQILNVNMRSANKESQMAEVSRQLKNLAKNLDIWIIALSQLNRDPNNPVPSLNRLRDSGQIAEAADTVILIYRPEVYNRLYPDPFNHISTKNTALIDVAKGRNTGTFKFIAGFDPYITHFYNLDEAPRIDRNKNQEEDPF